MSHDTRRQVLKGLGAIGITANLAGCTNSLTGNSGGKYPNRSITGIIPWGAGGGTDTTVRAFASPFEGELDVTLELENRSGASGRQGMNYLWDQTSNGYTIGFNDPSVNILSELLYNTKFKTSELTAIGTTATSNNAIFAEAGRWNSLSDMIQETQNNGDMTFGSSGRGTNNDFFGVMTLNQNEVDPSKYKIVPLGSGSNAATSPASGDTDAAFGSLSPVTAEYVKDGTVDVLAIGTQEQSELLPKAPTIESTDAAVSNVKFSPAVWGPPGIPDDKISVLTQAHQNAVETDEFQNWCSKNGQTVGGAGPKELQEIIKSYENSAETYLQIRG